MARIWYAVMGDGMGHAIESGVVISRLRKKHDILITTRGNAYHYLKKKFPNVHHVESETLYYRDNEVVISLTAAKFILKSPQMMADNIKTVRLLRKFKPDLSISDFESFPKYYSLITGLPSLSLGMVEAITETRFKPEAQKGAYFCCQTAIRLLHPTTDYHIIPTYAKVAPRKPKKTTLVQPILRDEILNAKTTDQGFVTVYQTSPTNGSIIPLLKKSGLKYRIYGMDGHKSRKNLIFKKFDERSFISDLASCTFLISNGGFTALSEAIYLKKPVLSLPLNNQGEQLFNAQNLKEQGFGTYTFNLKQGDIETFQKKMTVYKKNLAKNKQWDNKKAFQEIDSAIARLIN